MNRKLILPILSILFVLPVVFAAQAPVAAAPQLQNTPFPTPTPGADGRILYEVQSGDTLFGIAATAGLTVEELRSLNGFGAEDEALFTGQILLLGLAAPAEEPTATPAPQEATIEAPEPTVGVSTGEVCVLLFHDINGDAIRQEEEPSIALGAISLSERTGIFSAQQETLEGLDPQCFENVPEGDYNITVAIPEGYNPTTAMNVELVVTGGAESAATFGAQLNSDALAEQPISTEGGRSPILGIIGVTLLIAGLVLGFFSMRMAR